MCTWDDNDGYRPPTKWDKVAGLIWLFGFGMLCGAMLTMWIGAHHR